MGKWREALLLAGLLVLAFGLQYARQFALLAPLDWFATSWHEAFHALASWATGGRVVSLAVNGAQGMTRTQGGWMMVVYPAGYVGTAALGAVLLWASQKGKSAKIAGAVALLGPLVLMLGFFITGASIGAALIGMLMSAGVAGLGLWLLKKNPAMACWALSALFASESVKDVGVYLLAIPGQTDAGLMAQWMGMPFLAVPIALLFAAQSIFLWRWALRLAAKRMDAEEKASSV